MKNITQLVQNLLFSGVFITSGMLHSQVGIGTTTPSSQLEVTEDTHFNSSGGAFNFRVDTDNTPNMLFVDGANDRIGIGINNPAYDFEMKTTVAANYIAVFENLSATGASLLGVNNTGNFNAVGGVTNVTTGLGLYGVSLPTTGASGGFYGTSNSSDAIGVQGAIPTTGSWLGYGGLFSGGLGYINGLYNLSDERVKTDILEITNALEKLQQIKGVSYKYNTNKYNYLTKGDSGTYLGFLAQDIKKTFPEAVREKYLTTNGPDQMGKTLDYSLFTKEVFNVVDYTAIIPVLVEGIKEQQQMINNQTDKIKSLEEKIAILDAKINALIKD